MAVLALGVCAAIGASDAAALSCPSRRGTRPFGSTYAVAVTGDLGLVGNGALLEVVDLTAPELLPSIGEMVLADVVVAIAVAPAGDRLWVADRSGVSAVDITDPTHPRLQGRHPVAGELRAVAESAGLVYLADRDLGLRIVDFTAAATPAELGALASPGFASDVAVTQPYVYLADFAGGLRVIDVSLPSAPVEVGEYRPADAPYVLDVELADELAVVTVWNGDSGSLRTLDLADPVTPRELGVYSLIDGPTALAVAGSTAWVAESYSGGIHVVDIADPTAPVRAGFGPPTPGDVTVLAATERWAIGGVASIGAVVIDRGDPSGTSGGWFETPGTVRAIAAADGRIYAGGGGVRIVGAADPHDLVELGAWEDAEDGVPVEGRVEAMAVAGDHAFLGLTPAGNGWTSAGLLVLDASQPTAPVVVASIATPGTPWDLAVAGDHLLMVEGGLEVIMVLQPESPVPIATLPLAGAVKVAVASDTALLTQRTLWGADEEALAVVDITTPAAPAVVATLPLPCPPSAVTTAGDLAFVGCATAGLLAVDVAAPAAPVIVGVLDQPAAIEVGALEVSGGCLFVLEGDSGAGAPRLRVVDVSDPTAMRTVSVVATRGQARDLALVDGRLAIAEGDLGVSLLDPAWCACRSARAPAAVD